MKASEHQHIRMQSKKLMNSLFVGNFKAAFQGRGIEFQDFRPYSPDDDARFIDWCISSREWTTIMRRYREEKEGKILCVLENTPQMHIDSQIKQTLCSEIIALLWYSAIKSGESFGWYVISGGWVRYVPARKNEVSIIALENSLGEDAFQGEVDYSFLMQKQMKRAIVFIITPRLQENLDMYTHIAQKHDVILIHIASHFENTLEGSGLTYLRWWSQSLTIDLDNREKKQQYIWRRKHRRENMIQTAHKKWMSCISLDETSSLYREFLQLMKQRTWNR